MLAITLAIMVAAALTTMAASSVSTLSAGSLTVPYMPMTVPNIDCPVPIVETDFEVCGVPGGVELWAANGFYSPGMCFQGYQAECTQTKMRDGFWPLDEGETAVRCIPTGFDCNDPDGNPRFATTMYDGTILSAPAFEIRWRSEDLKTGENNSDWPTQWKTTGKQMPPMTTTVTTTSSELPESPPITLMAPTKSTDSAAPLEQTEAPEATWSAGETVGISVGCTMALFLVIAAAAYILRRHHQKTKANKAPEPNPPPNQTEPSYAVSSNLPPIELPPETMGPRELESAPVSPELQDFISAHRWPVNERHSRAVRLNQVAVEAPGDQQF